jgi:hypothetical protein
MALVPARIASSGWVARTSYTQLQKSAGECRASNKPRAHLQKEEAVRVNGGLGRRRLRDESLGEGVVTKGCSTRRS